VLPGGLFTGVRGREILRSWTSVLSATPGWFFPPSAQGKDDRRVDMTKVVCRYRPNLPVGVETYPRCIRANGLPKLSE
jgi:hypothetical protein